MEATQILICDDHPLFRDGLRAALEAFPGLEVVGEAQTGEEAVELAAELQPDVVVMDLHMPGTNGIDATRRIVHASPHIGVLVVTMFEDDSSVFATMRAGARGYLLKGAERHEIARAIQAIAAGEVIFGASIAGRVIEFFAAPPGAGALLPFPDLTEREREVLDLIAKGERNEAIAHKLALRPKTVRNHVSNIFHKLQVADRAQAIVRAREAGLGRSSVGPAAPA